MLLIQQLRSPLLRHSIFLDWQKKRLKLFPGSQVSLRLALPELIPGNTKGQKKRLGIQELRITRIFLNSRVTHMPLSSRTTTITITLKEKKMSMLVSAICPQWCNSSSKSEVVGTP
jgi:hypothetical protein